jgi:hypothetical protein
MQAVSLSGIGVHFDPAIEWRNGTSRAGLWDLRRGFLVEVIGWTLGMCGCCKDGTVVILENFRQVAI